MKTLIALTPPSKKEVNAALPLLKMTKIKRRRDASPLLSIKLSPKKIRRHYCKFYKVLKNDTSVTEVFTNDFKTFQPTLLKIKAACALHSGKCPAFSLPVNDILFRGFLSRIRAMEYAKAGALRYITKLIDDGEKTYALLIKYRKDHYEDLNINLIDRNISKLEMELCS